VVCVERGGDVPLLEVDRDAVDGGLELLVVVAVRVEDGL